MNFTTTFINLNRDIDKKIHMEKLLLDNNISFIRTEGYDFKTNILPRYELLNILIQPTNKEIYIIMSHIKALEQFYKNDKY